MELVSIGEAARQLGVGLDAAAALADGGGDAWRDVLREQITSLDDLIGRSAHHPSNTSD